MYFYKHISKGSVISFKAYRVTIYSADFLFMLFIYRASEPPYVAVLKVLIHNNEHICIV